jgi:hypothetical protein
MTGRGRFRRFSTGLLLLATGVVAQAADPVGTAAPPSDSPSGVPASPVAPAEAALPEGGRAWIQSKDIPEGGVVFLQVKGAGKSRPWAKFEGVELLFFRMGEGQDLRYGSIFGVPHGHARGPTRIELASAPGGEKGELRFNIVDGGFAHETLTVDGRHVNPKKKDMIRINRDIAEVVNIYKHPTLEKLWEGPWALPIDSPMTSPYGTNRLYNGEPRNFHGGLDLKAAVGTPVHAAASGRVVLAKDLFFTGFSVMIDHGLGLISLYAHMSKLQVKKGQRVKQGDLLGLSGMTGRVSGPHLHWQLILRNVKVNPVELMKVMRMI